jgi:hypothetical protein
MGCWVHMVVRCVSPLVEYNSLDIRNHPLIADLLSSTLLLGLLSVAPCGRYIGNLPRPLPQLQQTLPKKSSTLSGALCVRLPRPHTPPGWMALTLVDNTNPVLSVGSSKLPTVGAWWSAVAGTVAA